jgi:excisionase family DNA binding protein
MSSSAVVPKDLWTVRDVARCLSVSERTVWRWAAEGRLPAPVRLQRRSTRWRVADIRRYLDSLLPARSAAQR